MRKVIPIYAAIVLLVAAAISRAKGQYFEKEGVFKAGFPRSDIDPSKSTLNARKIEAILGTEGQLSDGVFKVIFSRTARMHNEEIGNAMGVNTWAAAIIIFLQTTQPYKFPISL